jgi:hypothetical protein
MKTIDPSIVVLTSDDEPAPPSCATVEAQRRYLEDGLVPVDYVEAQSRQYIRTDASGLPAWMLSTLNRCPNDR